MKTDMAGSAAVLGAMQVIAALKPPFPVHALHRRLREHAVGHRVPARATCSSRGWARRWRSPTPTPRAAWCWATCSPRPASTSRRRSSTWPRSPARAWSRSATTSSARSATTTTLVDERARGRARAPARRCGACRCSDLQKDALRSRRRRHEELRRALGRRDQRGAVPARSSSATRPGCTWTSPARRRARKERGYLGKGGTGVGVRTLVELVRRQAARRRSAGARQGRRRPRRPPRPPTAIQGRVGTRGVPGSVGAASRRSRFARACAGHRMRSPLRRERPGSARASRPSSVEARVGAPAAGSPGSFSAHAGCPGRHAGSGSGRTPP